MHGMHSGLSGSSLSMGATDYCVAPYLKRFISLEAAVGEPLLVLEHVTKSFGAVHALSDGSIELHPGEAHALVGENGAGKSTLVKILAGVHKPDSGRLTLDGKELSLHGPASRRAPPGSPSSTRSPRCSLTSRWPRTSSSAASPCAPGGASTGGR